MSVNMYFVEHWHNIQTNQYAQKRKTEQTRKREQMRTPSLALMRSSCLWEVLYPKHGMYPQDIHEGHPTSWKLGPHGRVGAKGSDT